MRRAVEIAVVLLLMSGGVALFYVFGSKEGFVLPMFAVFLRRAAIRFVLRFVLIFLIPIIPVMIIVRGRSLRREISHSVRYLRHQAIVLWRESPRSIRVLLVVVYAIASGIAAFLLLFVLPFKVQYVPFIGPWLSETAVPYLMRMAAATGIEKNMPKFWEKVPAVIRTPIAIAYLWVWKQTADFAVWSGQVAAKRASELWPGRKQLLESIEKHIIERSNRTRYRI